MTPTPGALDLTGTAVPTGLTLNYIISSPTKVLTGEPVTISIGMTNTREVEVIYSVPLKINGRVEATKEVTLASGASTTISFTVAKETVGTYEVELGDLSSSFVVQIDGQNGEFTVLPPSLGISWSLVGGIIAVVVVIALAIVFFVTQRRRAPSS